MARTLPLHYLYFSAFSFFLFTTSVFSATDPSPDMPRSSNIIARTSTSRLISPVNLNAGARSGTMVFTAANLWVDTTETTHAAYLQIMGQSPSYFNRTGCPSCPVENLTPYDAMLFANARTKAELESTDTVYQYTSVTYGTPGTISAQTRTSEPTALVDLVIRSDAKGFRLPTEAEWNSLQGGSASSDNPYWVELYPNDYASAANNATHYAWFNDNANGTPQAVAQKIPNDYGLYDMLGNVEEFTSTPKPSGYVSKGTAANATKGAMMMMMAPQAQWLTGVRLVRDPSDSSAVHQISNRIDSKYTFRLTPAKTLIISVPSQTSLHNTTFSLHTLSGRKIAQYTFENVNRNNVLELPLSKNCTKGVYIFSLRGENIFSGKFTVTQ